MHDSGPEVTRMLLRTDGSTTRLLEALLDTRLLLDLICQRLAMIGDVPHHIRTALGSAADHVVERRSALRTDAGAVVSVNHVVVVRGDDAITSVLTSDKVPIGHGLSASRLVLGRRVLACGQSVWPLEPENSPCAYKEYVLLDQSSSPVAYVHERFNPRYVPCGVQS